MKKIIAIAIMALLTTNLFAQHKDHKESQEKYKAQRVSYMTERMGLSPEEAQVFWPIYNQLDQERWKLHTHRRQLEKQIEDNYSSLTNSDFERINNELLSVAEKDYQLAKKYNAKFLEVLPAKKVVLIFQSEKEFRFKIIKQYRKENLDNKDKS